MINLLYTLQTLWKNFGINILDQLFNIYLQINNTFKKELSFIYLDAYYKPWPRSWVENHFKCIKKMCLCLEVGFVCFILKQLKYFDQILYGVIGMTPQYLMHCVLRKTLCTMSSVSERGDMDSENHSVVIRRIGSHYMKSTEYQDG